MTLFLASSINLVMILLKNVLNKPQPILLTKISNKWYVAQYNTHKNSNTLMTKIKRNNRKLEGNEPKKHLGRKHQGLMPMI